jgi:FixJ family two-component response regulator
MGQKRTQEWGNVLANGELGKVGWPSLYKRVMSFVEMIPTIFLPWVTPIRLTLWRSIFSLELGAIDFLPKPFNRIEVVVRITNMLRVQPVLQRR